MQQLKSNNICKFIISNKNVLMFEIFPLCFHADKELSIVKAQTNLKYNISCIIEGTICKDWQVVFSSIH